MSLLEDSCEAAGMEMPLMSIFQQNANICLNPFCAEVAFFLVVVWLCDSTSVLIDIVRLLFIHYPYILFC